MKKWILLLWPSFLAAIVEEVILFTLIDPLDLPLSGYFASQHRLAIYTLGFFCFWGFAAIASWLTFWFNQSAADINKVCPLSPENRPVGCPVRDDGSAKCQS